MSHTRRLALRVLLVAFGVVAPAALRAQTDDLAPRSADTSNTFGFTPRRLGPGTRSGEPRFFGGIALAVAQPVHDFHAYVNNGVGVTAYGLYRADPVGALALRLEGGYLNYGREHKRVSVFDGIGRVTSDLTTTNDILWLGVGPQLAVPVGPFRPYVNGSAGFAYFSTTSALRDRETDEQFASDRNQSDFTWAIGGGGGVLVPLARTARSMVMLDLGARYHRNGEVEYLRKGGIRDLPDGTAEYDVIRSPADLWTYHVGLSFGGR